MDPSLGPSDGPANQFNRAAAVISLSSYTERMISCAFTVLVLLGNLKSQHTSRPHRSFVPVTSIKAVSSILFHVK